MNIVQLAQGSQAWLDYRRNMRNASETAAVLGVNPWMTPYQLWLLKTGRLTPKVTPAMQHGTELEGSARLAYEQHTGNIMQPIVLQDGAYSASLDGMDLDGQLIVEIKCPYKGKASELWNMAIEGQVPEYYALQVQHQLMVSRATKAHLWVFDGSQGLLLNLEPEAATAERICQGWDAFQAYLDTDTAPPLTDADTVLRKDAVWAQAAQAFTQARSTAEQADAALARAREVLVGLATHVREQGAGVSVTRFWKAGAVDYKRVPQLQGVDLEQFRAKAREEVRVSATG